MFEKPEIRIHKKKIGNFWEIRITGIPSGFKVIARTDDNLEIICKFDAERFDPAITQSYFASQQPIPPPRPKKDLRKTIKLN